MKWLWAYFRQKTMEAILAGANDAISGNGSSPLSDEEAVRALRAMLGADQTGDPPALPASPQPAPGEQRRGPGRPRKFQAPQEPQE
jgi:hypothetical protein